MVSYRTLDLIIEDWEMTQTETETVTESTDDVGSGQGIADRPDPAAMHIPVFAASAALIIAVVSTVLITVSKKKKAQ